MLGEYRRQPGKNFFLVSKPIHHTFGPHADLRYCLQAGWQLLQPWNWREGAERDKWCERLSRNLDGDCYLFNSGREGLFALLKSLNFEPASEIIIQGYTCIALPNAIHAAGYTPVYADIDPATLNLDPKDVATKITPRTKAIICQHTFGIVGDTATLKKLCTAHNLQLIEDCAHVLPDVFGPRTIGQHADHLMLSFGRDKAVSGVAGGAILSRKDDVEDALTAMEDEAEEMPLLTIWRYLLYPAIYYKTRFVYPWFGKPVLWLLRRVGLLVPVTSTQEKRGYQAPVVHCMPAACCALARFEHRQIHRINNHRRLLTKLYLESLPPAITYPAGIHADLPLQKFPILVENTDNVRAALKKDNIHLDDGWTGAVVCPRTVDTASTNYQAGSCPQAEKIAQSIVSLPTHPTMTEKQAKRLIERLRAHLNLS